jgi:hypothetical protein
MKTAGLHLLGLALSAALLAQEPAAPPTPPRTSPRLAQEIRANLPKYEPPATPPDPILASPTPFISDTDILALPKVTVKEKLPPTHDPDVWMTDTAIRQKALVAYKQSMTDLEWSLNSWFIPLVTPPASARARHSYRNEKFRQEIIRLNALMDRIAAEDPKAAAELRQELKNLAEGRPAGSK